MSVSDRLLTATELMLIRSEIPGTKNVIQFAKQVSDLTATAQDAKSIKVDRQAMNKALLEIRLCMTTDEVAAVLNKWGDLLGVGKAPWEGEN